MSVPLRRGRATLLALALIATSARAAVFTWDGENGSELNDALNWVGDAAPPVDGTAELTFNGGAYVDQAEASLAVNKLTLALNGAWVNWSAYSDAILTLGAGGLSLTGSYSGASFDSGTIALASDQTWEIAPNSSLYIYSPIAGDHALTVTGGGSLWLYEASPDTDGFFIQQGSVYFGSSDAAGFATLSLADGVTIGTATSNGVTLSNPITLGTGVIFGNNYWYDGGELMLTGPITPTSTDTRVVLRPGAELYLSGAISDSAGGPTQLTFEGAGLTVLEGNNTYSGGTVVKGSGLIFGSTESLPAAGTVSATVVEHENGSTDYPYLGVGYSGGLLQLVGDDHTASTSPVPGKITNPAAFAGSLGFDSESETEPTVFYDQLDLSQFTSTNFRGLISASVAVFDGAVTPAGGTHYRFGGEGGGVLLVRANLPGSGSAGVYVDSVPMRPLTVYLQGTANSFSGGLHVSHSVVILDAPSALPNGQSFTLGEYGYVGYTENFKDSMSTSPFEAKLAAGDSYEATSVLGIDSRDLEQPVTLTGAVNLGEYSNIYFGTATAATLSGPLSAPSSGRLALLGAKGGKLNIESVISGTTTVIIGSDNNEFSGEGTVRLGSANTYTGGTQLMNGMLVVGHDAALGTGTLLVDATNAFTYPSLASDPETSITLSNNIVINTPSLYLGYAPEETEDEDDEVQIASFEGSGGSDLKLTGAISGTGELIVQPGNRVTLSGSNTYSGGTFVDSLAQLVVEANDALGAGSLYLGSGADLSFTAAAGAPVVNGLSGGYRFYDETESMDESYIELTDGATLTINQTNTGYFEYLAANIGGAADSLSGTGPSASVSAAIVKTGTGTLFLSGDNTYTGGTTVSGGTLVLDNSDAAGSGTITVTTGATMAVTHRAYLWNTVAINSGARLSGDGYINSATIGAGAILSPGFNGMPGWSAIGELNFADLTLQGGGLLEWNLFDPNGSPGEGWDTIDVFTASTLHIEATAADRFTLKLSTVGSNGQSEVLNDFVAGQTYSWLVFSADGQTGFDPNAFNFDATDFKTNLGVGGDFSLSMTSVEGDYDIYLNFTPVPEPSTYALLAMGLGVIGWSVWRRRQR